ncbi:hypothetical protein PHAVU_001G158800 [Phaseolus vulgaris]|uniref:C2H2-type domain-containing protein n=1 Tax=Phaseolus vulgaris TaxID=3885 RepID=V7CYP2_PHAVU|nr:hypothetical protein PHAVU_001G158800g [Phaseolus vulgaris]ESW34513.1 hypothetical protein PHAVU_001G158800g [Phaseolus vulgaris]
MDLNYPQDHDLVGTGRSYECIFCKRGFTTAQALGGHMNIHRKERANKTKPTFPPPPSTSNKPDGITNYADLVFHSQIPTHSPSPDANSFRDVCFSATALSVRPSHGEVLCAEKNQLGHVFVQDWRTRNFSFYTNPLCFHEMNKFEDTEENGLDLELRLGHHP